MYKKTATQVLRDWDKKGKFVFTRQDLQKLFSKDTTKAATAGINRLVKDNILIRACRGIYVNPHAVSINAYVIEHIAKALRRGHYNYISLESMLSEYGVISQAPIDRLTVMTTGRRGVYKTIYGIIEYTHTKRPKAKMRDGVYQVKNRPLYIASKETAWRDLKRVGRNIHLVNLKELYE